MKEAAGKCAHSWSIAWICCFINFLLLGVSRLSGLLYLASISRFGVERSKASLPFVLCYSVRNFLGPLIGYVGRRVEIRLLVACGCFLSAVGAGACFFAEDITTVTVLWGGVYGLGFGLGTMLLPQILNQHFEKYISIANGIAFGGECVAGLVLPVIVELFLDTYGTSGTFLILSGLILHGVPAALLLKSPKSVSKQSGDNKIKDTKEKYQYDSVENACIEDSCHKSDHSLVYDVVDGQGKCSESAFKNNLKENCSRCPLSSDNLLAVNSYPKCYESLKPSYYHCSKDNLYSFVSGSAESDSILRVSKQSSYLLDNETDTIFGDAVNRNINFENIADFEVCKNCISLQSNVTNSARSSSTCCHHSKSGAHFQSSTNGESNLNRIFSLHPTDFPSSLKEGVRVHAAVTSNDIIHCENRAIKQSNVDVHRETRTAKPSNDGIHCENTTIRQSNDDKHCKNPTVRQSNVDIYSENTAIRPSNDDIHPENRTIRPPNDGIHRANLTFQQSDNIHCENMTMRHSDDDIHCENTTTTQSNHEQDAPKRSSFYAFRVFLDPTFILILFTQSAMIFIFTTVMTIIVDFARDAGVSGHQEVYVLMCLSVSDLIGRFGLGWVTDLKYMSNIAFSAICYAGTAILMVALVYLRGFLPIMTVAFLIGLFLGGLLITGPGIIRDFIEEDKVTMALASRLVLYAPMSLTQSSLIGFFREKLGSYSGLFYILGFNSFLCCIFSLLVPCAFKWRSRKSTSSAKA